MTQVFQPADLLGQTFLQHVEVFDCIDSTQNRAMERCGDRSLTVPALIVAERQTAGRGREGARWWSPEGALLFSLLVPLPPKFAEPESSGQLSLALAGAVANYLREALRPSGNDRSVRVKPPNDVYVADAKIAGLLIDVPHQPGRKQRLAVVGLGLNVNNACGNPPEEIAVPVTSICEQAGHGLDLQEVLVSLLAHIERALGGVAAAKVRNL